MVFISLGFFVSALCDGPLLAAFGEARKDDFLGIRRALSGGGVAG
jgi:hypothetical protein